MSKEHITTNDGDDMVMEESRLRGRVRTVALWTSPTMAYVVAGEWDADGGSCNALFLIKQ